MKVGIIGGGMLGLSLAYYLGKQGIQSTVFEARPRAGGLIDYFDVDGTCVDKYYHCILNSDADLLELVDELGLRDRVRFAPTKQGFYSDGKFYPMTSGKDFLLFPPLTLMERFRLGLTILGALRVGDWHKLDEVSVENWLVGLGGRGVFDKIWRPLLRAKFDGGFQTVPATYIWSRLKRVSSTRTGAAQKELMGYFVGSYKVLIERLVDRIQAMGSTVALSTPVQQLVISDGRVTGIQAGNTVTDLDAVIVTAPLSVLDKMVPAAARPSIAVPATGEYLGVVCGVLLLDRSLTPYYTLNIADEDIPFTGLIETTNLIAPEHVGNHHLVYLPKYVTATSPYALMSDNDLLALYVQHLEVMFPEFDRRWIKHHRVFRERFVEPLHQLGKSRPTVPFETALGGLYVVNNGQIYPELTNCQASVRHALRAIPAVLGNARVEPAKVGSN